MVVRCLFIFVCYNEVSRKLPMKNLKKANPAKVGDAKLLGLRPASAGYDSQVASPNE